MCAVYVISFCLMLLVVRLYAILCTATQVLYANACRECEINILCSTYYQLSCYTVAVKNYRPTTIISATLPNY